MSNNQQIDIKKMNDDRLRIYVDEIFLYYDKDRSGTLDERELTNFFNEILQKMNDNKQVNEADVTRAIRNLDQDFNGVASKEQIFKVLSKMMGIRGPTPNAINAGQNMLGSKPPQHMSYQQPAIQENTQGGLHNDKVNEYESSLEDNYRKAYYHKKYQHQYDDSDDDSNGRNKNQPQIQPQLSQEQDNLPSQQIPNLSQPQAQNFNQPPSYNYGNQPNNLYPYTQQQQQQAPTNFYPPTQQQQQQSQPMSTPPLPNNQQPMPQYPVVYGQQPPYYQQSAQQNYGQPPQGNGQQADSRNYGQNNSNFPTQNNQHGGTGPNFNALSMQNSLPLTSSTGPQKKLGKSDSIKVSVPPSQTSNSYSNNYGYPAQNTGYERNQGYQPQSMPSQGMNSCQQSQYNSPSQNAQYPPYQIRPSVQLPPQQPQLQTQPNNVAQQQQQQQWQQQQWPQQSTGFQQMPKN